MDKYMERVKTLREDPNAHHNCAQAVLEAFAPECGLTQEKAFKLGRLIIMGADKTYLPVALLAAGVVVTDGTTAVTCTAADTDPA